MDKPYITQGKQMHLTPVIQNHINSTVLWNT